MELSGYAVYDVCGGSSDRSDRWTQYCYLEAMETGELTSVIVYALQILMSLMHGNFCICHDHDRRGIYRPYYRGSERSTVKCRTKPMP